MPIVLLTEHGRGVRPRSLPIVPGKRASYHDASLPRFMVRVTPNGTRTYYVWMRVARGKPRFVRIGDVRAVSLAVARQTAHGLLDGARAGVDPREERRRAQAEAQQASLQPQSVRELAERFLAEGRTKRGRPLGPATRSLYGRSLQKHVYPLLGKVSPADVRRGDVRALIEAIRARHPVQANRTLAALRRLFNRAVEEKEFLRVSPCVGVKVTAEKPRDRVLSNDELRRILAAAERMSLEQITPLVLHTGSGRLVDLQVRPGRPDDFLERTVERVDQCLSIAGRSASAGRRAINPLVATAFMSDRTICSSSQSSALASSAL